MIVTVQEYFDTIEEDEAKKPEAQRRSIPSQAEFARAAGVERQAFHRWLKKPYMDDKYFDAVITKMRAYGFNTDLGDLAKYVPPE